MHRMYRINQTLRLGMALLIATAMTTASAQIWGPLTLDELKAETQRRADRNLPPIAGIRPDDARAAVARMKDLERETWANEIGRAHV